MHPFSGDVDLCEVLDWSELVKLYPCGTFDPAAAACAMTLRRCTAAQLSKKVKAGFWSVVSHDIPWFKFDLSSFGRQLFDVVCERWRKNMKKQSLNLKHHEQSL